MRVGIFTVGLWNRYPESSLNVFSGKNTGFRIGQRFKHQARKTHSTHTFLQKAEKISCRESIKTVGWNKERSEAQGLKTRMNQDGVGPERFKVLTCRARNCRELACAAPPCHRAVGILGCLGPAAEDPAP